MLQLPDDVVANLEDAGVKYIPYVLCLLLPSLHVADFGIGETVVPGKRRPEQGIARDFEYFFTALSMFSFEISLSLDTFEHTALMGWVTKVVDLVRLLVAQFGVLVGFFFIYLISGTFYRKGVLLNIQCFILISRIFVDTIYILSVHYGNT